VICGLKEERTWPMGAVGVVVLRREDFDFIFPRVIFYCFFYCITCS